MYVLNIIMPTFMLFAFVWGFALIAIVGNFVIDAGIYYCYLEKFSNKYVNPWKYIWKAYGFGFLADFIGAGLLIVLYSVFENYFNYFYIFDTWYNVLAHVLAIGLVGYLLYVFNRFNLKNTRLDAVHIHRLSLIMALATAPYTFLIPASMFGW